MADAAEKRGEAEPQQWFTTQEAALYLRISPKALQHHVNRGNIRPDTFGGRGRTRGHRFARGTLDRFLGGDKAA